MFRKSFRRTTFAKSSNSMRPAATPPIWKKKPKKINQTARKRQGNLLTNCDVEETHWKRDSETTVETKRTRERTRIASNSCHLLRGVTVRCFNTRNGLWCFFWDLRPSTSCFSVSLNFYSLPETCWSEPNCLFWYCHWLAICWQVWIHWIHRRVASISLYSGFQDRNGAFRRHCNQAVFPRPKSFYFLIRFRELPRIFDVFVQVKKEQASQGNLSLIRVVYFIASSRSEIIWILNYL